MSRILMQLYWILLQIGYICFLFSVPCFYIIELCVMFQIEMDVHCFCHGVRDGFMVASCDRRASCWSLACRPLFIFWLGFKVKHLQLCQLVFVNYYWSNGFLFIYQSTFWPFFGWFYPSCWCYSLLMAFEFSPLPSYRMFILIFGFYLLHLGVDRWLPVYMFTACSDCHLYLHTRSQAILLWGVGMPSRFRNFSYFNHLPNAG